MNTDPELWRMLRSLQEELVKQRGRELYLCADGIIWHRDGDRMIPLTDEGDHINPLEMKHRGSLVMLHMRNPNRFPTFTQLQSYNKMPLMPVTELDVVKRHVRKLEARLSELEG